jgi:hypothetical protein
MASATIVNYNYSNNNDMLDKNDKASKQIKINSRNNIDTDLIIKFSNIHETYTWLSLILTHIDYSNQLSKEFDNNHHHTDIDIMKKISRYIKALPLSSLSSSSSSSSSSGVVMISNPMLNYKKSSQHVFHDDDMKEKAFSDDHDDDDEEEEEEEEDSVLQEADDGRDIVEASQSVDDDDNCNDNDDALDIIGNVEHDIFMEEIYSDHDNYDNDDDDCMNIVHHYHSNITTNNNNINISSKSSSSSTSYPDEVRMEDIYGEEEQIYVKLQRCIDEISQINQSKKQLRNINLNKYIQKSAEGINNCR